MKNLWNRLARLRWPARISLKAALLLAVVAVVLFPHPGRLVEEVQALRNPEPLIQPDFAGMKEINAEIDRTLKPDATKAEQFKAVERFVYQKIKYQYDWNNWANLDYWPKAEDVWARKREDCDGRAVLAASILRARGFHEAKVVANLNHAWVMVGPDGLMGPQRETNIRREGGKTVVTIPGWQTWLETLAFVSEFPAGRSMIILFAVLLLAYHPCRSRAGFFGVTTMGLTGFVLLLHWGKLRMDKEITGLGFDFVAAATLLLGALALALLMPRLLARNGGEEPVESTAPEAAPVLAGESTAVPAAYPEAS